MTRIHRIRTRTRRPAAAKREAARIVALIDAAACEAQAIDDAEWMQHSDPFTRDALAPDFGAEARLAQVESTRAKVAEAVATLPTAQGVQVESYGRCTVCGDVVAHGAQEWGACPDCVSLAEMESHHEAIQSGATPGPGQGDRPRAAATGLDT